VNYYNEHDAKTAAWLRELIKADLIAEGEVDERSIVDVAADDLRGFVQCHFFAGIGGWSYALRLAGWPDDRPVWTGSCPCQPWSVAGSGEGADDPRHLWPAWFRLIEVARPPVVFGEQVASEDGRYWLDLVYADLEACDYAVGAVDLPACGIGAPHKRARLWFVANTDSERCKGQRLRIRERRSRTGRAETTWSGEALCDCGHRADAHDFGAEDCDLCSCIRFISALDNTERGRAEREPSRERRAELAASCARQIERGWRLQTLNTSHAGATRGFWSGCEWLWHRDGVYRAVEPGTFPVAPRLPGDVERIRAYGNAIVPQVAAEVIGAYMDLCATPEDHP
jgi:DNA (cytosine-5)-methyltransferase 1